jgi:hypothetical protein
VEKAGMSPPVHSSASGSSPPSLMCQSRMGFVEPAAPGKVVAAAVPGGRASGPGSAGGSTATSEGNRWETERSSRGAAGPPSVGTVTAVPGLVGRLGGRGISWRGDSEGVGGDMGPGPAHGPHRLSREGLAPGRPSKAVVVEGAPVSTGMVSELGVTMVLGTVGGKGVSTSLSGGGKERNGL